MDKYKPEIVKPKSRQELETILKQYTESDYSVLEILDDQIEELVELTCIGKEVDLQAATTEFKQNYLGTIVAYPWRKTVVRILLEDDFYTLLTSRNRYLINHPEQLQFKDCKLAVAGLSVGSNIVLATVMQGGCKDIKIADGDKIATSNMNRIVTDLCSVGVDKTVALARKLYEINPYINVKTYSAGITPENIGEFIEDRDIVFDEIDTLYLKLDMRLEAKKVKIPLVMITDNGDNIMVDIERYDKKNDLTPFHGLISSEDIALIKEKQGKLSPQERVFLSLKIVQPQNAVERMQDSLLEVGKTIKTWPQLATASLLAGSVGSYIIRQICLDKPLNDGRLHVSTDSVLVPEYNSKNSIDQRKKNTDRFLSLLSQ